MPSPVASSPMLSAVPSFRFRWYTVGWVVLAYVACVLFFDQPLAHYYGAADAPRWAAGLADLTWFYNPLPLAAMAGGFALVLTVSARRSADPQAVEPLRRAAYRWAAVLVSWAAAMVAIRSLDIILHNMRPRDALVGLAFGGREPDVPLVESVFLSGGPETVWPVAVALVLAFPNRWVAAGAWIWSVTAAWAVVLSAQHYLGDVVLGSALAAVIAAAVTPAICARAARGPQS